MGERIRDREGQLARKMEERGLKRNGFGVSEELRVGERSPAQVELGKSNSVPMDAI